jgi:hypothetical protein
VAADQEPTALLGVHLSCMRANPIEHGARDADFHVTTAKRYPKTSLTLRSPATRRSTSSASLYT